MKPGEYGLVVCVWVCDGAGHLLLTKRAPEKKSFPNTWENSGGSAWAGESSRQAIARELYEETGAQDFRLYPIGAYAAADNQGESQGMLYFANIAAFGPLPGLEIGEITLAERIPGEWTYPAIQPFLLQRVREWLSEGNPRIS